MLRMLFVEFWPVILPSLIYILLMILRRRKAKNSGDAVPGLAEGPWFVTIAATLVIAIGCFLLIGSMRAPLDGTYTPAHMENGVLIQGTITRE